MDTITINFSENAGKIKPMHAVNNGPVYKFAEDQRVTNIDTYRDAGIPYARTHDASFYATYGGEHTVDVHAVFPDFDADPYDPASYDFVLTDEYLRVIEFAGTEPFYRLGSKIEHWKKKYGTLPPKDFKKWAVICEHIIRHFTEGWADGFHKNITYWEIWNEPDLNDDDSPNKLTWGGTKQQFFELYHIAATHLKQCFPHLKIGGPALAGNLEWARDFFAQLKAPLDFFSWHIYATEPKSVIECGEKVRGLLDEFGFQKTESILNEWNYVKSFIGDAWIESLTTEKNLKGSSFILGTMCQSQASSIDMLMYYDARPGSMNGMFNTDLVCKCLKGYYPFKMFNTLYQLKASAAVQCDGTLHACAASDGKKAAVIFTNYCDDDHTPAAETKLSVSGFADDNGIKASYYLLDEMHDLSLVKEEQFHGDSFSSILTVPLFSSYLVVFEKLS